MSDRIGLAVTTGYEYRGLMAETWDLLRGDPTGRYDRDFYLEIIREYGQPVLDTGCGTGRLLLDFLEAGIDVDGVDLSPEMLAICRRKALLRGLEPTLHQQAIEAAQLPRRYRTILAPSSILQLIPDPETVRRATQRLYDHLLPGGVVVAPFMTLWCEGMPLQREWEDAKRRESDGALLHRMGRVWYDPKSECEHSEDLYQVVVNDVVTAAEHHRRSPASRSYTQSQARRLFEEAGFTAIRLVRGFTQAEASGDEPVFTIVAVKGRKRLRRKSPSRAEPDARHGA